MAKRPSSNGTNGDRDLAGRFKPGWKGGPGNPHARRTAEIRRMIYEAVSPSDLAEIIAALVKRAKRGNLAAIGMVLDRLAGKPANAAATYKLERDEAIDEEFDVGTLLGR